jgi:hypothetical protein
MIKYQRYTYYAFFKSSIARPLKIYRNRDFWYVNILGTYLATLYDIPSGKTDVFMKCTFYWKHSSRFFKDYVLNCMHLFEKRPSAFAYLFASHNVPNV